MCKVADAITAAKHYNLLSGSMWSHLGDKVANHWIFMHDSNPKPTQTPNLNSIELWKIVDKKISERNIIETTTLYIAIE